MGTSLRDQLLKAGLVNERQVKQAEKQHRKQQGNPTAEAAARKQAAQQAQAAKAARDLELNRRNAAKAEARARQGQVRQLIEQNRLPKSESEEYYCFQDGRHVRRIPVDAAQRGQLIRGELAIARYGKGFALLPLSAAARVRERDPRAIVDHGVDAKSKQESEDDPYKGFEVPDDLIW
jgi:uncharacterized protein